METTHFSYKEGTVNISLSSESLTEVAAPSVRYEDPSLLVEACFTPKELETISSGEVADVSLFFTISDDIDNDSVKNQLTFARESEEVSLGKLTEGVFLDMSSYKSVGDGAGESLTSLSEDTLITIDIPLYLIAEDRSYWVLMDHMGECILMPDMDSEPNSITIATRSFGTGVILYQDPLDSLSQQHDNSFHISSKYFIMAGIVFLAVLWVIVDRLHKKGV